VLQLVPSKIPVANRVPNEKTAFFQGVVIDWKSAQAECVKIPDRFGEKTVLLPWIIQKL
jgi:hypothetical protein